MITCLVTTRELCCGGVECKMSAIGPWKEQNMFKKDIFAKC